MKDHARRRKCWSPTYPIVLAFLFEWQYLMDIAAAFFTTCYKKALEKVGTRPTKPGDLLLPTRVPEWSHVREHAIFHPSSIMVLFVLPAFAQ
jgi:hypothetical protein